MILPELSDALTTTWRLIYENREEREYFFTGVSPSLLRLLAWGEAHTHVLLLVCISSAFRKEIRTFFLSLLRSLNVLWYWNSVIVSTFTFVYIWLSDPVTHE